MKKMVCEICGCTSLRKENGVFVCQECGTEYSLEEARGLLVDVDEPQREQAKPVVKEKENKPKITEENDKYELLAKLSLWANYLAAIESYQDFEISTTADWFWNIKESEKLQKLESRIPTSFTKLRDICSSVYQEIYEPHPYIICLAEQTVAKLALTEADIPLEIKTAYKKIRDELTSHSDSSILGTVTHKGDSFFDLYPTTYKADGKAHSLVKLANDEDLLSWANSIIVFTEGAISNGIKVVAYQNKFFRGDVVLFDFTEFGKALIGIRNKKGNKYDEDYRNIILPEINKRRDELFEILSKANEFIEAFNLPLQYRTFQAAANITAIIMNGKADTWKEAVRLYDEEVHRGLVLEKFDELNSNLVCLRETIQTSFSHISQQLSSIDLCLSNINVTATNSLNRLKKIEFFSFITAINTI